MAKSLKTNFIFNMIHVISGLVFPLITFPYASRMLMADGIGQVQFFSSIVSYIILLTGLGIPMYGVRQVARVRDDVKELSKTTTELILLNLFLNVIGYLIIIVLCCTVAKIQVNIPLFLLLSSSIILTTIGCPWFYSGVEDFKYITLAGLAFKTICVAFLFVFVHGPQDLLWYGLYTVMGSIGNYLLNFFRLRKYIHLNTFSIAELNIKRHVKPACEIFVLNLVTSIYINLDSFMVGAIKDVTSVGYYTAATRLSHILVMAVTSLGTVMLPRSANLIHNGDTQKFAELAKKSYNFILLFAFPICMGLIAMAPTLIKLFCGDGFMPAVRTLRIMSPIVIAIGVSNLIGLQVLYPLDKIKIVTLSTCVGAAVNFTLNCVLIPVLAQDGAAIATVVAEISVTFTQIILARKFIPFSLYDKRVVVYISSAIIMFVACLALMNVGLSVAISMIVVPVTGILIYGTLMVLFKDELCLEIIQMVKTKLIK